MINDLMKYALCGFVVAMISTDSSGHDTTHIHPLITSEIRVLIKDADGVTGAYSDIYKLDPDPQQGPLPEDQFLYWGTDYDPFNASTTTKAPTDFYQSDEGLVDYTRYSNVIDGVVQEDVPSLKVLDHFYHAKDGIGLSLPVVQTKPSAVKAMAYFNEAVARMSGYQEGAIQAAFFEFGQALHHVEDMSSPAHIHNDPHLTLSEAEKDDYEGWFLPQLKKADPRLDGYFSAVANIKPVTNPWENIWGTTSAASMVNYFYDKTTYMGTLQFPTDTVDEVELFISGDLQVTAPAIPPAPGSASGELKDMFPCPGGTNPNCLHWEEEDLMDLAHWKIDAVGSFRHQYYPYANPDSWWAVEIETDPDASGVINQGVSYQGKFYIEQLSLDNSTSSPDGVPVEPEYMRSDFNQPWDDISNPTSPSPNGKSLLQIYAENLLVPAVEFGAGFTQYWYDVANTPPYLKSLQISQRPDGVSTEQVVYSAVWLDQVQVKTDTYHDLKHCALSSAACLLDSRDYDTVTSRTFTTSYQNSIHVDAQQGIVINFEFNEPMKEISLFRIGEFNESNVCIQSNSACLDKTAPAAASTDGINWTLTLAPAELTGLNGKLLLTIRARDKNNHQRGTDCTDGADDAAGGELDGTPGTPARRDLTYARTLDGEPTGVNCYPWHSQDNASPTADNLAYSYDYADGDQNHWLIFDTASPTSNISVDTSLPASQ
jgi:hypothetical protein